MTDSEGAVENEWDADDYDGDHAFVYEYGSDLLALLSPEAGEQVLDLGCGTGALTQRVADAGADVVGVDSSRSMVAQARTDHQDPTFVQADGRRLPFDGGFDAVLSNAALHWITDQDAVLDAVSAALEPGGRFVGELGGTGNVQSIVDAVGAELERREYDSRNPWFFPSVGEYARLLESHGFEVRYARLFDRPTELDGAEGLRNWVRMFGDELLAPVPERERDAVLSAVEDRLRPSRFDGDAWIADYRRLRFVAVSQ